MTQSFDLSRGQEDLWGNVSFTRYAWVAVVLGLRESA
jgi:hypothetical protein